MPPGYADVIVGLDYGDEGKGRITDIKLSGGEYSIAARFNGGNNAGHTLIRADGQKIILHSIPSGVLFPNIINYIGSGCVVDPVALVNNEIPDIQKYVGLIGRLKISTLATAITPVNILLDQASGGAIGTTGRGIGPAYRDKAARAENGLQRNLRLAEVVANPEKTRATLFEHFQKIVVPEDFDVGSSIEQFISSALWLDQNNFLEPDPLWLTKQVDSGKNVLMEGAQAYGLDVTYGATPFTTSSNTIASNAYVGGDLAAKYHRKVFGVTKAITSRVGAGPFVGEFGGRQSEDYSASKTVDGKVLYSKETEETMYRVDDLVKSGNIFDLGVALRMKTGEYGATTGRPRRIGMIDLVRLGNAIRRTGVDELYITKVDCLSCYSNNTLFAGQIPLITNYQLAGREINYVPVTADDLYQVIPKVDTTAAFSDISLIRSKLDLPQAVLNLIKIFEDKTNCRVAGIGVGPGRDEMVFLSTVAAPLEQNKELAVSKAG